MNVLAFPPSRTLNNLDDYTYENMMILPCCPFLQNRTWENLENGLYGFVVYENIGVEPKYLILA